MNTVCPGGERRGEHNPLVPVLSEIVLALIVFAHARSSPSRSTSCRASRRRSPSAPRRSRAACSAAETKQAEADAKLAELEKQLGRRPARGRAHPRGGARAGCRDRRRDAGAGPGRGHPHRRARQDPDRGRAPAGGHLAPCRGRHARHRPRRSHRRARAWTTRLARAASSSGSSPTSRRERRDRHGDGSTDACEERLPTPTPLPTSWRRLSGLRATPQRWLRTCSALADAAPLRAGPAPGRDRRVGRRRRPRPSWCAACFAGKVDAEVPRPARHGGRASGGRASRDLRRRPGAARRGGRRPLRRQRRRPPRGRAVRASTRLVQAQPRRCATRCPTRPARVEDKAGLISGLLGRQGRSRRPSPLVEQALAGSHRTVTVALADLPEGRRRGPRAARRRPCASPARCADAERSVWPHALSRSTAATMHLNVVVDPERHRRHPRRDR